MTRSIPFLATLLRWFRLAEKPAAPAVAQPPEDAPVVRLHRTLLLRAQGQIQLMTNEMSLNRVYFQTSSRLDADRILRIEALLQGEGPVNFEAKIDWILQSAVGWRGQLSFQISAEQRPALERFLLRQSQSRRG